METDDEFGIVRFQCCNETVKLTQNEELFCVFCGTSISMTTSNSTKVFLSHKGIDKTDVTDYKQTLSLLGYDPWIDEDAMPAGTPLERALLQGMNESCGVVFFITPSFKDEGYLETEVNYAIQEKRKKGDKFAIIALQFVDGDGNVGKIPELLKTYVWKKPATSLQALREIIRALPIVCASTDWRPEIKNVVTAPKIRSRTTELSEEAKAILTAAASGDGSIMRSRTSSGDSISAGRTSMIPDQDGRTVARWFGGLEDLQRRRYIKDLGHKGQVFEATREGYEAADELSSS